LPWVFWKAAGLVEHTSDHQNCPQTCHNVSSSVLRNRRRSSSAPVSVGAASTQSPRAACTCAAHATACRISLSLVISSILSWLDNLSNSLPSTLWLLLGCIIFQVPAIIRYTKLILFLLSLSKLTRLKLEGPSSGLLIVAKLGSMKNSPAKEHIRHANLCIFSRQRPKHGLTQVEKRKNSRRLSC